jgi:hypothetical protein
MMDRRSSPALETGLLHFHNGTGAGGVFTLFIQFVVQHLQVLLHVRTDLVHLLVTVQLVPVLAVPLHQVQRLLEVELELLHEDRTQVAGLNPLLVLRTRLLLGQFDLPMFPEESGFLCAVEVEGDILFASDIVLGHDIPVEVSDCFLHVLEELFDPVVVFLVVADALLFEYHVDFIYYVEVPHHLAALAGVPVVPQDLELVLLVVQLLMPFPVHCRFDFGLLPHLLMVQLTVKTRTLILGHWFSSQSATITLVLQHTFKMLILLCEWSPRIHRP